MISCKLSNYKHRWSRFILLFNHMQDITYRNIRPFSGYVARHRIYRKSLVSNTDYEIIADEPIVANEMLKDPLTHNQFYNTLGHFYNQKHLTHYWFTSSNNISMQYTPDLAIDSALVSYTPFNDLGFTGSFPSLWDNIALDFNQWNMVFSAPISGSGVVSHGLSGSNYFMIKNDSFSGSRN